MDGPTDAGDRNPRGFLAFLAAILAVQGLYAGLEILPDAATGGLLSLALGAAFVAYALMIAVFAFGVWRRTTWAWMLAVAITIVGLGLAAIQIAGGAPVEKHLFGMAIDLGLLLYLQKPSIKSLFERA